MGVNNVGGKKEVLRENDNAKIISNYIDTCFILFVDKKKPLLS
jgi:hypothetical protein